MSKDTILKSASLLIAIILLVASFVFVLGDPDGPGVLGVQQADVQFAEVDILTKRLNDISSINIDDTIFSDETFDSLKNFDEEVYVYQQGRENPFEALDPSEAPVITKNIVEPGKVIVIDLPGQ